MSIPRPAVDLIVRHEGCPPRPYWPRSAHSGVSLGVGYDLGHQSLAELEADWIVPARLTGTGVQLSRLRACVGKTGLKASEALDGSVRAIAVNRDGAMTVFEERSLPKYEAMTVRAFPGVETLDPLIFGALVSIVFNRGSSFGGDPGDFSDWDDRGEMKELRRAVAERDLAAIPAAILSMTRLWVDKGLDGLLARREDEARLVESAMKATT